jgi:hypothetical protein
MIKLDSTPKKLVVAGALVVIGVWMVGKWLHSLPKPVNPDLPAEGNNALKLSKGMRGLEVGLLQKKLGGLVVDGIFGQKTEDKLMQVKGVKEITLNDLA